MAGITLISTVLALWAAQRNAEQAIWQQVKQDAELVGAIIAETIALSREVPDDLEASLEKDMISTALLLAEYVALAERVQVPRAAVQQTLQGLAASLGVAEIWITDSSGKVVYSIPKDVPFTFSPDPALQPQASEFWPLISGKAKVVTQQTRRRDLDDAPFKYIGVTGADRPRIVQLGVERNQVDQLRSRLSLARLNESLVRSGVLAQPLLVVDKQLQPIDQSGAVGRTSGYSEPSIMTPHVEYLKAAMIDGGAVTSMQADAAVIYRSYSSQSGRYQGAFVAAFPRDALDTLLAQQRRTFVTIGSVVFLAASALGWLIANRLTGRLATISRAARDLQKGRFDNLTELEQFSGQSDEIARLGQVVHDMGKEVQNREAILEGEVRKRTEELALRNEALAASQAMIRGELELAKRLQLGILPSRFPSCGGYEGSARVRMQQQMGGDFYDFIPRADGTVAVVVADVSGKGIAAAFFMAMARTSLAEQLTQGLGIEECLSRSNEVLCQSNPLNLFVTVFVALIEPNSGRVCYANAGHNPPVHLFPQGDPQLLPMRGELALGVMEGVRYSLDTLHLKPGEALLTYTDGITEAFDDKGRAYGETRLLQWARLLDHQASAEQSLTSLLNDVDSFQDAANQSDDITMALIRRLPNV